VPLYPSSADQLRWDAASGLSSCADAVAAAGVRFDLTIPLPWRFEPVQGTIRIHPGERTTMT
jgi:cytochrome c oxidase assembly protein Cox11